MVTGCGPGFSGGREGQARLSARPDTPTGSVSSGTIRLGTGGVHDGYLYVPASYQAGTPMPLVLALHGAGGDVSGPLDFLGPYAETHGFLIVAVKSAAATWDGITGRYGTDVASIDAALRLAFERCSVDPARVALEGFSDGASYALGLGIANGSLFSRIVAFSPGFLHESDSSRQGDPEFFVSHGRQDPILPIDDASRVLVPALQRRGYQVTYLEFDGGHTIPSSVAEAALVWMIR